MKGPSRRVALRGSSVLPGSGGDVVPLYHRIYVVLLQKLSDGSFPPGVSMPSEDVLADSFGVSRVTIRKALERLEREGLVLRQRGRGTFPVTPQAKGLKPDSHLMRNQISLAQKTRIEVLHYGLSRLPAPLTSIFGVDNGTEVLRIVRVRHDTRSPISLTTCYLPADLGAVVPKDSLTSLPISAILSARGIRLARFHERITATLADSDASHHLGIDVGSALIAMTRWIENDEGRVVELLQALYRIDRYEYRVEYTDDDLAAGGPWKAMITDSQS